MKSGKRNSEVSRDDEDSKKPRNSLDGNKCTWYVRMSRLDKLHFDYFMTSN